MIRPPLITIVRLEDNFQYGMFGVLLIQTEVFCVTLEPFEYGNRPFISCIPAGCYECERKVSFNHGTTYEIQNVPGRDDVLLHKGNKIEDTEGCVILAEKFGKLQGNRAILNSGSTFIRFMNEMNPYKNFNLIIKEIWR